MIEILRREPEPSPLNFRQRWASYLTIAVTIIALAGGFVWRARIINATDIFQDTRNGITARYPANWLLDQSATGENLVFRVQDPTARPFKTTLQVGLLPSSPDANANDITYQLATGRAAQFASYSTLDTGPITLANGTTALRMNYAYIDDEPNPFLQTVPIIVRGTDMIVLSSKQAIVISYRADAASFDRNYHYFDAFLRTLEF